MRLAGDDKATIDKARYILELWHDGIRSENWQAFDAPFNSASKKRGLPIAVSPLIPSQIMLLLKATENLWTIILLRF
jgi:hypothetical protein